MALCKPKSGLKRKPFMKRREENLIRTLNFQDSDDGSGHDEDSVLGSSPMCSPVRKHLSNNYDDQSPEFLELDIPECAMISSPKASRRFTRRRRFSPTPFGLDEVEEEAQQVPGSEVLSPDGGDMSPPHRKLRALRLFDTPHTPKSLLEKARKRRPTGDKPRIAVDRPQANVNPFTPSPQGNQNDSGYCGSGKRSRTELERYISLSIT
jgi:hypothetical protein